MSLLAKDANLPLRPALLLLRLSLGGFLLLWGIDKLLAPFASVVIFKRFYGLSISSTLAIIAGVFELALALAIIVGLYKIFSYGLGLLLPGTSVVVTHKQWLLPFDEKHLFIAALPILGAFIVLFLLRDADNLWSLDAWREKRQ
ncbi:MAG: hypothetical protein COC09_08640 [Gammaproteobacteria bacterium]|nr:DoxX family membrane protein [Gammaproteobacteria bacterium]PCH62373.1 MAG: hypothetical protein COC09_08640 [Gammaproteobacteria bacterium]